MIPTGLRLPGIVGIGPLSLGKGVGGPSLRLSNNSIAEDAEIGDVVGTLSVVNGSGSYTFSIIDDPQSKFAIDGDDLETADTFDYETLTSHSVTIEADNGVDDPISRTFSIAVTNVIEAPVFTVAPVVSGDLDGILTCSTGTLQMPDGAGATFAYQWKDASDDSDLDGETANTLDVSAYDGLNVYCTVMATNSADSTSEDSNTVGPLVGETSEISAPLDVTLITPQTNPPGHTLNLPPETVAGDVLQVSYNGSSGTWYSAAPFDGISWYPDFTGAGIPALDPGDGQYAQYRVVRDPGGMGEIIGASSSPSYFDVASEGPWTPASEASGTFDLWLDGADASTIVLDTGAVAEWTDKSGNGDDAVEATLRPNAASGGGVQFPFGNYKLDTTLGQDDNRQIFIVVDNVDTTIIGPTAAGGLQLRKNGSGELEMLRSQSELEASSTGFAIGSGQYLVELHLTFGEAVVFGVNGTLETASGLHDTAFSAANVRLGQNSDGFEGTNGIIREVLIYSGADTDLASNVRDYLTTKWSIS